jgi:hypothetical protein
MDVPFTDALAAAASGTARRIMEKKFSSPAGVVHSLVVQRDLLLGPLVVHWEQLWAALSAPLWVQRYSERRTRRLALSAVVKLDQQERDQPVKDTNVHNAIPFGLFAAGPIPGTSKEAKENMSHHHFWVVLPQLTRRRYNSDSHHIPQCFVDSGIIY